MGDKSFNGYENNVLFRNLGDSRFIDVAAVTGSDRPEDGRGLGISDIDNDGDLDLVIQNYGRPANILVNRGDKGNALQVRLRGVESNRSAIGARLAIRHGGRTQTREVVCGAGYLSSQTRLVHFGLGDAASVDELRVQWPSGRQQVFENLSVNRRLHIVEGEDTPEKVDLRSSGLLAGTD